MIIYLRRETDLLTRPARILHLAPEPPVHAVLTSVASDYSTLDLAPGPLIDVVGDAQALPFETGTFDAVICSHVLEHVQDDRQVVSEFSRVLKPEGFALVQIPVELWRRATYETHAPTDTDRVREYGQHDHLRVYGADVAARFRDSFTSIDRIDYAARCTVQERTCWGLRELSERRGADIYRMYR